MVTKKNHKTELISIRLTKEQKQILKYEAEQLGVTVTQLILGFLPL